MPSAPWYQGYEIPNRLWLSPNNVEVKPTEDGFWLMKGALEFSFTKQSVEFEASLDDQGKLKKFSADTYVKKADISPLIESVYWTWKRLAEVRDNNEQDAEELRTVMSEVAKQQTIPDGFKRLLSSLREEQVPVEKKVIADLRRQKKDAAVPLEKRVIAEMRARLKKAEGENPADQTFTRADIEDVVRTTGSILDGISSDLMAQIDSLREIKGLFAPANDMSDRLESIYQMVLTARQTQLEAERGLFPDAQDRIQ